jgi:hypothetical protein
MVGGPDAETLVAAAQTEPATQEPTRAFRAGRWAWPTAFAASGLVLFAAYLRQARTVPIQSDGASNALQAWDMLHGNVLLRGWTLSDVSFYTTELPQYVLVELAHGLNGDVVHVAAAMSYTLIVLGAALLARGRARGRGGAIRMLIAAGIMLAPSLGTGTVTLLSNPDHTGTQVPMLAIWLILDRAGPGGPPLGARHRGDRSFRTPLAWIPIVAVTVLLAWVQIGDPLVLYEGVLPLVLVCAIRVYRRHGPLAEQWYELSLAAGAIISAGLASLALKLIYRLGGFAVRPPGEAFAVVHTLYANVWVAVESVLLLFGADFSGQRLGAQAGIAVIHLVGVALAVWGVARALRRFGTEDLIVQVLAVTAVVLVVAFVVRGTPNVGGSAHEIAGVLPIGAVLAGRLLADPLLADPLFRGRHLAVLAAVLVCYLGIVAHNAVQQPPADANPQVTAWLAANHLSYGLADYWNANAMTADSGGQVQVRPISRDGYQLVYRPWESDNSWYDPAQHNATFLVLPGPASACSPGTPTWWTGAARATFGRPSGTYRVGEFVILVWHKNLLSSLITASPHAPTKC